MPATVGQPAPDFSLRDQNGNTLSLSDLKGSKAVIVFIPNPNTGICDGEACAIRDDFSSFERMGAKPVIITTHSAPNNRAWAEKNGLQFPVLSDYWPHGAVAQAYGCFNEQLGVAMRSSYLLDENGIVREIVASPELRQAREHSAYAQALSRM